MLDVHSVVRGDDHDDLEGWWIDRPVAGRADTHVLHIDGWVVGRERPVPSIEVLHAGHVVAHAAVDFPRRDLVAPFPESPHAAWAGFRASLSTLELPAEWSLDVVASSPESRPVLARIVGRREPLRTRVRPKIQPLLLTTLGRTGSTWVTHVLAHHPKLVHYRSFQFEPHVAGYWVDVLRGLARPQSSLGAIDTGPYRARPTWWLGDDWPRIAAMPEPDLEPLLDRDQVDALAQFCHERIDAFIRALARMQDSPRARYFIEKAAPDFGGRELILELYPAAREIAIVRDFRDVMCSVQAFADRRGFPSQARELVDTDVEYVSVLAGIARGLIDAWKGGAHLLRYEDIVLDPEPTVRRILEFLDLDASDRLVRRMLDDASREMPEMATHRTTTTARDSIGRFRHDLDPALLELVEQQLGPALAELGYEVG